MSTSFMPSAPMLSDPRRLPVVESELAVRRRAAERARQVLEGNLSPDVLRGGIRGRRRPGHRLVARSARASAGARCARRRRGRLAGLPAVTAGRHREPLRLAVEHRFTVQQDAALPPPPAEQYAELFQHGTLRARALCAPRHDPQEPHTQDEVYLVLAARAGSSTGRRAIASLPATCSSFRPAPCIDSRSLPTISRCG